MRGEAARLRVQRVVDLGVPVASCGAFGLVGLGVLGWVSERHGPVLTYGEVS